MMEDILQQMLQTEKEAAEIVEEANRKAEELKRAGAMDVVQLQKRLDEETRLEIQRMTERVVGEAEEKKRLILAGADESIEACCSRFRLRMEALIPDFTAMLLGEKQE